MNNTLPAQNNLLIMPTSKIVEYFLSQYSEGSSRTYGSTLRAFFIWTNGKSYKEISPFEALEFDKYIKTVNSDATVQRQISTLKKFFDFAMECGLIDKNPFAVIKQKGADNKCQEKFLTTKELNSLLDALYQEGQAEYVLGLLLASLGLRISEAAQLSHNDFLEAPSGEIEVSLLRKGNKKQLLPLRDDVWQVVKNYMGHGVDPSNCQPLFLNPSKRRISSISLRAWVEKASKKAGISKTVTPHWIRHTTATLLLDKGVSLENVAWLLNHANIATTSRYLHPTERKISEKMPIDVR